jgi:FlaA1/EpsC-like NDP-sugar epimerase
MVPHQDIAIEFSGLRPGEKLYEELNMNWEEVSPTAHPRIAVFKDASVSARDLRLDLQALRAACAHRNAPAALSILQNLVPDYTPSHEIRAAVAWLGRQEQAANVHTLQTVEQPA